MQLLTKLRFFFLTLVITVFSGSVPSFAKYSLQSIPPFMLVCMRFFFALLVFLPFLPWKKLTFSYLKQYLFVGFIGALNPIILFVALQFTRAAPTPLYYAGIPALTAAYLAIRRKQHFSSRVWIGVVIGFIGVLLIFLLPLLESSQTSLLELFGNGLIFLSVLAFLAYGILSKDALDTENISPLVLTFVFVLVGFVVSLPFAVYEFFTSFAIVDIRLSHFLSVVYLGIFGTGVFYLLYQFLLKRDGAVTGTLFTLLQPIVTALTAVWLLAETISLFFVVGGALALVGAYFASVR